ncbi:MAG: efflux RND transporter periplasmic adaptor subunit [Paucibacter sp.]|nr:efflux RND transporter periplasmic adaptor subunit [Roseateles sp.]
MIRDTSAQDRVLDKPTLMRRRGLLIVTGVALAAALVFIAPSVLRAFSAPSSVSASRLSLAKVETGPFVRDIAGEGKVVAANSPTLYAPSAGSLTLLVKAGEVVKKGQLLARLESPELAARLAQERSNVEGLRAEAQRAEVESRQQASQLRSDVENAAIDLKTAQTDLDRQAQAFKAGATAGMQVDHARDTLEKARITLAHAQALLVLKADSLKLDVQAKRAALERQQLLVADLQRQVDELQMRSPADGQVGQLFVDERATVAKDAKVATVIDLSALEVQMQVAESFARELGIGMAGDISGNGRNWKGRVSTVSPEVVNGEVAARLRFDGEQPEALRQNQRLTVRVLLDQRSNVTWVHRGSFADEMGGTQVYVVRDGLAEKVPVKLGARSLDKVEVLSGLKAGDVVVVSGAEAFNNAPRVAISN